MEPVKAEIINVQPITEKEKLFKIRFLDENFGKNFRYEPGQFIEIGIMGLGEAPISICKAQDKDPTLELCIRNTGRVTASLHKMKPGEFVWVRGPYGNGFPLKNLIGRDLVLVAGGLGIAPLRGVLQYLLNNRSNYGNIKFLYGVRNYDLVLFKDEINDYFLNGDKQKLELYLSYEDKNDPVCRDLENKRSDRCTSGVVTNLFKLLSANKPDTAALLGGPPVMYKFVAKELLKREFDPMNVYITLERRMRCGLGQCGHCIVGSAKSIKYVCKDGPVFTLWETIQTNGML